MQKLRWVCQTLGVALLIIGVVLAVTGPGILAGSALVAALLVLLVETWTYDETD